MGNSTSPNLIAGGNIAVSTFVKVSTAAANTALQSGAGDFSIGISQAGAYLAPIPGASSLAATAGNEVQIFGIGNICQLQSTTAGWTQGDLLKSDASGNGVTASSSDYYGAVALETVSGAALGRVQVLIGKK